MGVAKLLLGFRMSERQSQNLPTLLGEAVMAVEGFTPPGGTKETMVANISTTTRPWSAPTTQRGPL